MPGHPGEAGRGGKDRHGIGSPSEGQRNKRDAHGQEGRGGRRAEPAHLTRPIIMGVMVQSAYEGEEGESEYHSQQEKGALCLAKIHTAEGSCLII